MKVEESLTAMEDAIKREVVRICETLGEDASELGPEESIPASGLIDSAGLLELLAWYEVRFGLSLKTEEITIDNLGSIRQMAQFARRRRGSA
jgi:acyl carrier protein